MNRESLKLRFLLVDYGIGRGAYYEKMQAMALSLFHRIPRQLVLTFFQKDEKRLHMCCILVGSDGLHH